MLIETDILFQHCQTFMKKLQTVLEISKIFVQGGGCTCTLPLFSFMGEMLSEERASYNSLELKIWVGIFQVEILGGNFPGGNFPGGSLMGGNFSGGNFPRTFGICVPLYSVCGSNFLQLWFYFLSKCAKEIGNKLTGKNLKVDRQFFKDVICIFLMLLCVT